jgi:hypothetical protein
MFADFICEAIRARLVLEFDYDGRRRIVAPYCHGVTAKGDEVLRAVQLRGWSRSGGLGFGKLWMIRKISNPRSTGETFTPDDPDYNPHDSAMSLVHCCV